MLEIQYVALPGGPLPSLSNRGHRVQDGPAPGGQKIFFRTTWLRCLKFSM